MFTYLIIALILALVSNASGTGAGLGGNLGGTTYKNPYASKDNVKCQASQFGCLNDFWCDPALGLAEAGFGYCYLESADGQLAIVPTDQLAWLYYHGTKGEKICALVFQWLAFALCVLILGFYAFHYWKATTGWEEVYVCLVELVKVLLEIFCEYETPASLYLSNGEWVLWIRYGEWLLTCPVILIHLSNLTGLKDDYSKRTMRLLVSDIGCVVWGITSAMSSGYIKWVFFLFGMLYGFNTYFHAAKVYIESYHTVPKGHCRQVVRLMALFFFTGWTMYPLLFALGPEGLGIMNGYQSTITNTVADIMTKQLWSLLGHHLRVKIFEHILIHGDIRKTTKLAVAGEEVEVEEFVEEEDEDTVKHSTTALAKRESFVNMGKNLKQKGYDVRASIGGMLEEEEAHLMGGLMGGLEPGRVILAVNDLSMVDFFKMQFSQLPAPIELVPALGDDNTLKLVQQAATLGGCDCVLAHPELLRDRSANGLVSRLHMVGQRVVAFGWTPVGPVRDLIESCGLDGWIEGPSFGTGINVQQLTQVVARMQAMRKQQAMMNMMGGYNPAPAMVPQMFQQQQQKPVYSPQAQLLSHQSSAAISQMSSHTPPDIMVQINGAGAGVPINGNNPLFAQPTSPLGSQAGFPMQAHNALTSNLYAPTGSGSATPTGSVNQNEAEMLQQLMGEINRLKSELGVPQRM